MKEAPYQSLGELKQRCEGREGQLNRLVGSSRKQISLWKRKGGMWLQNPHRKLPKNVSRRPR